MQKVKSIPGKWRSVVFSLTALLVVAVDQLSKTWIRSNLDIGQSLPETGFFRLTRVHNTGSAFGLFQDQSFALSIIALTGVAALLIYTFVFYRRFPFSNSWLGNVALGLVLGGVVGNLIDRLRFGSVTDFIDIGIWPAFNVADSAAVVGVIIFVYTLLPLFRAEKRGDGQAG